MGTGKLAQFLKCLPQDHGNLSSALMVKLGVPDQARLHRESQSKARAGEMVQWVKTLAAKSEVLNSTP